jgi:hypothetical protein
VGGAQGAGLGVRADPKRVLPGASGMDGLSAPAQPGLGQRGAEGLSPRPGEDVGDGRDRPAAVAPGQGRDDCGDLLFDAGGGERRAAGDVTIGAGCGERVERAVVDRSAVSSRRCRARRSNSSGSASGCRSSRSWRACRTMRSTVRGPGWFRNSDVRRLIVAATVGSVRTAAGCVAACARSMRDLQCREARSGAVERPTDARGGAGVVDRRSGAGGRDAPAGDGVVAPGATPPTPPRILRMPGAQGSAVGGDGIVRGRRCTRRRCWCRHAGPYRARSPVGTSVAGARGCGPYVPWVAPRESTVARFFRSAYPVIASGDNTSPRIDGVGGALMGQPSSSAAGMVVVAATDGVPPRVDDRQIRFGS